MSNYINMAILPSSSKEAKPLAKTSKLSLNTNEMPPSATTCRMLSIPDVCTILGIGTSTVRNLLNRKKLPAKKLGKRTLVRESDLSNYIDGLEDYEGTPYEF